MTFLVLAIALLGFAAGTVRCLAGRVCLGDVTSDRVIERPTEPADEPIYLTSACGRVFVPLQLEEWRRFADLRATEALRTASSGVRVGDS